MFWILASLQDPRSIDVGMFIYIIVWKETRFGATAAPY
jgi:hypothetical protein